MTWTRSAITAGCLLTLGSCTVINPTFGDSGPTGSTGTSGTTVGTSEQTTTLSSTGSSGSVGSASSSSTASSTTDGVESSSSTTGDAESTDGTDTIGFIGTTGECLVELPDGVLAHCSKECSTFLQDCPLGEACKPWSSDGAPSWNAFRCSSVDNAADSVGDPCSVEVDGYSGLDTCGVGSMCWGVDSDTNIGTCIGLCGAAADAPECAVDELCSVDHEGVLSVCLPQCDPLLGDCSGTCAYVPPDGFGCVPDGASPCAAGFAEVDSGMVVGCGAGEPCCTPHCDTEDPLCGVGLECQEMFEDPIPGYENVGVCVSAM